MEKTKILNKARELFFGEVTEEVKMAEIAVVKQVPMNLELADGIELTEGVDLVAEDGIYMTEDGTIITIIANKVSEIKKLEVEEETEKEEVTEEALTEVKEEMSTEIIAEEEIVVEKVIEIEPNVDLEKVIKNLNDLKSEIETLKSEKVEMSSEIEKLKGSPAVEEVKEEKAFFSQLSKDNKLKNLMKYIETN